MSILLRVVILALALLVAWAIVRWWERRRRGSVSGVPPGVTMITSASCVLCPDAFAALKAADPQLSVRVLDAQSPQAGAFAARAAPTVVVADRTGSILLRRTGRSTITDAAEIAATARRIHVAV